MLVQRHCRQFAAACVIALAACGGGGGGGGPGLTVTSNRSSVQFVGFSGIGATPQTITFTLVSGSGTYYGTVVPDVPSDFSASFTPTSATTADVTLALTSAAPTSRSGSVTFKLCSDQNCNSVAWSQVIPYTIGIFEIDLAAVSVSGFEGAAGTTRTLAISPPDTQQLLAVSASTTTGAGWLTATRRSATAIDISTSGVGQSAGTYQGQVNIGFVPQAGGFPLQIPVTFTVGNGAIAPAVAPVDVTVDATRASLERGAPITFNGNLAPAWSASSDQPWLVLTQASGVGPGELRYTVDPTLLGGVANWSSAHARITLVSAGLSDIQFDITTRKQLPEVHWVSAGAVVAGRASTVRVTGRGFSQLPSASRLLVAGVPGVGLIQSDTQAVIDLPPLPSGRAAITVTNAAGEATRGASVGAMFLSNMSATSVPNNSGEMRSAFFDASRNAVYAISVTQNSLVRYRVVNGSWVTDGLPITLIDDMAMGPDRETIYVGSGDRSLLAVNPDTMLLSATYTLPLNSFATLTEGRSITRGMAVTRDLRLWFGGTSFSTANYFDLLRNEFGNAGSGLMFSPVFFASGDGSRMVTSQNGISPAPPTLTYTVTGGSFGDAPPLPFIFFAAGWSEDGSRVLLDETSVYDGASATLIGSVQLPNAINLGSVLSPDGRRVYTLVTANLNSLIVDHIDVYDATQVQPGTSQLVKLGELPVSTQALVCNGQVNCSVKGLFFISPLGDTLFWLGNQALVVQPIPSALSGVLAAKRLLPAAVR